MKPVVMKDGACGDCRVRPWDSYFTCLSFSFLTHEARMRTPVLEGHWEVKNTQHISRPAVKLQSIRWLRTNH